MDKFWQEDILGQRSAAKDAIDAHMHFECVKSHYRQTKDGLVLSIVIHPSDAPPDLILAPIGQRFMCVMVPIDDHEKPVVSGEKRDIEDWIRLSGIMCNDLEFQQWLKDQGLLESLNAQDAAQAVRDFCNVSSRVQFRDHPEALKKFKLLHGAYVSQGSI